MFFTFFKSELAIWSKSLMLWIFLVVSTILVVTILTAQDAMLDDVLFGNSFRNSPFVIQRLYGMMAVFGCLMVTAFVNSAATRDFTCQTAPLIFTKPIGKYSYLMGRFWAAMLISLIPMLGVSLAVFVSQIIMPGPQWGPNLLNAHLMCVLVFALPNTFFLASVVFSIAIWTRSALASFLGILGMMVFISISSALTTTLGGEILGALADPFGDSALAYMSKYWTVADKNAHSVALTGVLLWNRVLWVTIGFVFLVAGCLRFSFTTRLTLIGRIAIWIRATAAESFAAPFHTSEIPAVSQDHSASARVRQFIHMTFIELWVTLKSPVFICMMFGVFLSVITTLSMRTTMAFGLSSLPVTFLMVELIQDSLEQFLIVLITFYAGVFVWKERDSNLAEILDACPTPTWLPFSSKLASLLSIVISVVGFGLVCGVTYQAISGFYDIQISVYVMEMLVLGMVNLSCLTVLAVLCHVISPNKYVGYFGFVAIMVANAVVWPWLGVTTNLLNFGSLPNYVYSDLFGRAPYASALRWFGLYWLLFAGLMGIAAILLWPRGCESGIRKRLSAAITRWTPGVRIASIAMAVAFAACTGWIYWNTQVRNAYSTANQDKIKQARYEKEYRQLADQPQPRVTDIRYEIDIYPKTRGLMMRGDVTIENKETEPVSTILVFTNQDYLSEVEIEGATLVTNDQDAGMLTFEVKPPMAPGTQRQLKFVVTHETVGFENNVSVPQLVQNGTFLNSFIAPQVGYQPYAELKDLKDREKYGLPGTVTARLDPANLKARRNSYLSSSSDWVNIETVISTSDDQIAIAPGSLLKKWRKDGRRYFHYKLDRPSANFYSFVSARYKVAVNHWNGIDIEVYHHPSHDWNVNLMLRSVRESLKYYSEAFGPYQHKQARIVEFPRVAEFAQAFPGTMPYGESIGFIADLQDPNDIDMVFYVVAHEIAHQWWAHQVVGADMQGATLLSETLAQYSALMVMEKEYGRDQMRRFLKYEMDNYLRARGREKNEELPLSRVESSQGYIHYNKGSVAMYHLKETIGEENLNRALKSVVGKFAYSDGPYPTSADLIAAIREQTPPEHYGLLADLFEHITLFENETIASEYKKTDEDHYEVTVEVNFKKLHAESDGRESEVKFEDWIEIGAFSKPSSSNGFGKTLYRKRFLVTEANRKFTFTVNEKPVLAGVDPFSLLIDRNTANNMKKPTLLVE